MSGVASQLNTSQRTFNGAPFASDAANNGLSVDPVTGRIVLGQDTGNAAGPAILLSNRFIPMNGFVFQFLEAGGSAFLLDPNNGLYLMGDTDVVNNGTGFQIDDPNQHFTVNTSGGQPYLDIDATNDFYQFGDINNVTTGWKIQIAAFVNTFLISDLLENFFNIDATNRVSNWGFTDITIQQDETNHQLNMGDVNGMNNGTTVTVDDTGRNFIVTALNGIKTQTSTIIIDSATALTNGAGAAVGTLNNAPAAGNPTKWVQIIDAGVNRFIPAW